MGCLLFSSWQFPIHSHLFPFQMSDVPVSADNPPSLSDPTQSTFQPPPVEKLPRRPAPTQAYSFKEYNPNVKVLYVRNHEQANRILAKLHTSFKVFGFDLEWKPTFQKGARENPVSLIQLANDDTILLFQVTAMRGNNR